jgi:hypothetical protein
LAELLTLAIFLLLQGVDLKPIPGNAQETWGRELLADLPCFRESSSPARKGSGRAWKRVQLAWIYRGSPGISA